MNDRTNTADIHAKPLPMSPAELNEYGYETPDFVLVTGDAYIDHPSFGPSIPAFDFSQKLLTRT